MIVSIGTCIIALIKVIYIDFRFLIVYIFMFPLIAIISYKISSKYKSLTYEIISLNTKYSQVIHESIAGINEIKSNNLITGKENELNKINAEIYKKTKEQNTVFSFSAELLTTVNLLSSIGIVLLFAYIFSSGELSIGQYIGIISSFYRSNFIFSIRYIYVMIV